MNQASPKSSRTEIASLALVLILGAGLRLHGLAENGIWTDEMFTLINSSGRWTERDRSAGFTNWRAP
jgi:hypothetical protein